MALPPKAAARVDAFLSERKQILAALEARGATGIEARWGPIYGDRPSAWEQCVEDIEALGSTRAEAIGYLYQQRLQGRDSGDAR